MHGMVWYGIVFDYLYSANSRLYLLKRAINKSIDSQSYDLGKSKVLKFDLKMEMSSASFKADGRDITVENMQHYQILGMKI